MFTGSSRVQFTREMCVWLIFPVVKTSYIGEVMAFRVRLFCLVPRTSPFMRGERKRNARNTDIQPGVERGIMRERMCFKSIIKYRRGIFVFSISKAVHGQWHLLPLFSFVRLAWRPSRPTSKSYQSFHSRFNKQEFPLKFLTTQVHASLWPIW